MIIIVYFVCWWRKAVAFNSIHSKEWAVAVRCFPEAATQELKCETKPYLDCFLHKYAISKSIFKSFFKNSSKSASIEFSLQDASLYNVDLEVWRYARRGFRLFRLLISTIVILFLFLINSKQLLLCFRRWTLNFVAVPFPVLHLKTYILRGAFQKGLSTLG